MDKSSIQKIWEGEIATKISLAQHEINTLEQPNDYYIMLPRNLYLPLFTDKIQKHFIAFTDAEKVDEVWFDYDGAPVKWHYPIGVIFDLLTKGNNQLPWELTLHFQDFPSELLIRCPQLEAAEANFMSALKEADQLKHRGQIINSMNKTQHKQLWHSLRSNNFDQFWHVNRSLMAGYEGKEYFKSIPIRVYFNDQVFQKPISSFEENKEVTLKEALQLMLPNRHSDDFSIIIQGISPPLDSPLQWLSENLSYVDNFLHVIVQ